MRPLADLAAALNAASVANPSSAPTAAVALILCPPAASNASVDLLFIVRADNPDDAWSGHVAFPGGRTSVDDAGPTATAIRETYEEIGLDLSNTAAFACLGPLPRVHVFHSRRIAPVVLDIEPVVFASGLPAARLVDDMVLEPSEVRAVLSVPLTALTNVDAVSHIALPLLSIFAFVDNLLPETLWREAGLDAPLFGRLDLHTCGAQVLALVGGRYVLEKARPMLWGISLRMVIDLFHILDEAFDDWPRLHVTTHPLFPHNKPAQLLLTWLMYTLPSQGSPHPRITKMDAIATAKPVIALLIAMAHWFSTRTESKL